MLCWNFSSSGVSICAFLERLLGNWSIFNCESEHASFRKLLDGAGPARNHSIPTRERVLEETRVAHVLAMGHDPNVAVPATKRKAIEAEPPTESNPLYEDMGDVLRELHSLGVELEMPELGDCSNNGMWGQVTDFVRMYIVY